MPLSIQGIVEIEAAASDLGLPLYVLVDPAESSLDARRMRRAATEAQVHLQGSRILAAHGIESHYPSLLLLWQGEVVGDLIPGFKTRSAYESLVVEALGVPWREVFRMTRTVPLPRPEDGEFFKPVPGTLLAVVGWSRPSYLFNTASGDVFEIRDQTRGDGGVTPDGEFITIVSGWQGLHWYSVNDVLTGRGRVLMIDAGVRTYQSMGLIQESSEYRVLGAATSSSRPTGLLYRDYRRVVSPDGFITIVPTRSWTEVCPEQRISLPMLSKTGQLISGTHRGTVRVFEIQEDGRSCDEVYNTGLFGGKAEFSPNDGLLVFVAPERRSTDGILEDVVVMVDLEARTSQVVYRSEVANSLTFPAFVDQDQVVLFDRRTGGLTFLERGRALD